MKTGKDRKMWFSADLDWLTQRRVVRIVRDGVRRAQGGDAARRESITRRIVRLSMDDTRLSVAFGTNRPVMHDAT